MSFRRAKDALDDLRDYSQTFKNPPASVISDAGPHHVKSGTSQAIALHVQPVGEPASSHADVDAQ